MAQRKASPTRYPELSAETQDGILFGLALMGNPEVLRQRDAYYARVDVDRTKLATLTRDVLSKAIAEMRLWTLPEAFEQRTDADMVEAIAFCMQGKNRAGWLAALGQDEWRAA